ncbi:MAG TPA: hypothetical protein VF054_01660 [Micromonosporaceae bacterium]
MPKAKQRGNAAQQSRSEAQTDQSDLTEQPVTPASGEEDAGGAGTTAAEPGPVAATTGFTPGMGEPGVATGPSGKEGPAGAVAAPPTGTPATAGEAETGEPAHRQPIPQMPNPLAGLRMAAGIVRAYLPPRDRLIFYGGLGAAAALGAVDLPVAVAIGAGVWVATHRRVSTGQPRAQQPPALGESVPTETVPAATSPR